MNYNVNKKLINKSLIDDVVSCYEKYEQELIEITKEADDYRINKTTMLPYRTVEMLYIFIREQKPNSIVEFSPHDGWSTFWMLKALEKNNKGIIHSFDLINNISIHLKKYIQKGYLKFYCGDVKENLTDEIVENSEFFYIDTEHTAEMASWYENKIFQKKKNTNNFFGVDDVFHKNITCYNSEAEYIVNFINKEEIKFISFDKYEFNENYELLNQHTKNLKQGPDGSCNGNLTTIFFNL